MIDRHFSSLLQALVHTSDAYDDDDDAEDEAVRCWYCPGNGGRGDTLYGGLRDNHIRGCSLGSHPEGSCCASDWC